MEKVKYAVAPKTDTRSSTRKKLARKRPRSWVEVQSLPQGHSESPKRKKMFRKKTRPCIAVSKAA
jgi:hypothetical protein